MLEKLAKLVRYWVVRSTTKAGSGHPTTALSATDLLVALFFNYDLDRPGHPNNDRVIFSKGHGAPLLYALYAAAGAIKPEELDNLRQFDSELEGHPVPRFKYAEVATGSLGQGLSVGLGMALNGKYLDKLPYKTYVLLGDSEMAEGSVWEAVELAAHYQTDNLVAIIDVNRWGQANQTMYGHDTAAYAKRLEAFGWQVMIIDGHNLTEIETAFAWAKKAEGAPKAIVAKTIKGRGVKFLEDKPGHHGVPLSEAELARATKAWGKIDFEVRGKIAKPEDKKPAKARAGGKIELDYPDDWPTRKAYGLGLALAGSKNAAVVALDAEVKNSTYAQTFGDKFPERFFEMYIAEQNMVGVALGLSKCSKVPFASTFAAFLTRAFDQLRMAAYSKPNLKIVGSHAGVSIGQDGPSQMGLEDMAMMRSLPGSVVFYPADAAATVKLVAVMTETDGLMYLRTTRPATNKIYAENEAFKVGGSKTLVSGKDDQVTIVAAGITVYEALTAAHELKGEGIKVRVIDAYSIKPVDKQGLLAAAKEAGGKIITVEDHRPEGGLGEAVMEAVAAESVKVYQLAVGKIPRSGTKDELLAFEEIDAAAIVKKVKEILVK